MGNSSSLILRLDYTIGFNPNFKKNPLYWSKLWVNVKLSVFNIFKTSNGKSFVVSIINKFQNFIKIRYLLSEINVKLKFHKILAKLFVCIKRKSMQWKSLNAMFSNFVRNFKRIRQTLINISETRNRILMQFWNLLINE